MFSRRTFIAVGAGAVLASCSSKTGSDSSGSLDAATTSSASPTVPAGLVVVQRYPSTSLTPGMVRLPVSLARADGTLIDDGPDSLSGSLLDSDGKPFGEFSATRHGDEMLLPYWPVTVDLAAPGIYYLAAEGATGEPTPFQLFDPTEVKVPTIGSRLSGFDTPTTEQPRGVDPICTRSPDPCPFHAVTLTDALATGKHVIYMIGTPAHCQTGTCAPGLEFLVRSAPTLEDRAVIVHAEVYADNAATKVAPAVTAAGLDYEPVIFVTDANGTITDRIDIIWDGEELATLLERAIS